MTSPGCPSGTTRRGVAARVLFAAVVTVLCVAAAGAIGDEPRGSEPRVAPGSVLRWRGAETSSCGLDDAEWPPIGDVCWYPVDLLTGEGPLVLHRLRAGRDERSPVWVTPYPYPQQRLTVAPAMVDPPAAELERIRREQTRVAALWNRVAPRRFTLPLAPPIEPMPEADGFGSRRILNGEPRSPHSGIDLAAPPGAEVYAAAAGTVVLADDLYFSGNSVLIDHGDQLVTMYFHLAEMAVAEGAEVDRGQPIGTVGATGRATGPHLHFAVRWHGARVDPTFLLADPTTTPELSTVRGD